ncbi:hypothetical protein JW960_09730 [candidate division KSB1 bacterium]|nr:hypothetical protein [candidate division KSB1 bacterium]
MRMKTSLLVIVACLLIGTGSSFSQDQVVLIPKSLRMTPYAVNDNADLFGKAWRFYRDGYTDMAADSLRKLVALTGYEIKPNHYYVVVANFTETETAIGMFHGDDSFNNNRLYGLKSDSLFYVFISREDSASTYLSTMVTRKDSYFQQVLPYFITLFPFISQVQAVEQSEYLTWVDIRKFEIPKNFQENCDISMVIKRDFYRDEIMARIILDNTSLEKWSYGIATGITNVDDVDIIIDGGKAVIRPKPRGDLATFGVINYHPKPIDTKARTIASSFHLLGGLRISNTIEPIIGAGIGVPTNIIDVHFFTGFSLEFANELKNGYHVGDTIDSNVEPFQLKLRGKFRFGLEVRFP